MATDAFYMGFAMTALGFVCLYAVVLIVRQAPRIIRLGFTIAICWVVAHWAMREFAQTFLAVFLVYLFAHRS